MIVIFQFLSAFLNAPVLSQVLAIVFIVVLIWFFKVSDKQRRALAYLMSR
ncbi:hypothetical protein [Escherichia coli]|nr:hypothetical protein [Escherichia coli]